MTNCMKKINKNIGWTEEYREKNTSLMFLRVRNVTHRRVGLFLRGARSSLSVAITRVNTSTQTFRC